MVQRTGGVNIQAFQVVAEALDGVDALFGAVVGQGEAANAFIQIGMVGVDADQSGHGALVVAQLHQYFAQFFQLAGGHGSQGVEVHGQQAFVPVAVEAGEELRQVFQFRLFQADVGKAQQLPGQVQPVTVGQLVQAAADHHQQGDNGLHFPAEQGPFAAVDAIGDLPGQQFQLDRHTLAPDPEQDGGLAGLLRALLLQNFQDLVAVVVCPVQVYIGSRSG